MDMKLIISSTNNGITQHILMLGNYQIFYDNHRHNTSKQGGSLLTYLIHTKKCPRWLLTSNLVELKLIVRVHGQIVKSMPYDEKGEKKACQLKLYPIIITNCNLNYDLFRAHIFTSHASPFPSYIQLSCLFRNGLMK